MVIYKQRYCAFQTDISYILWWYCIYLGSIFLVSSYLGKSAKLTPAKKLTVAIWEIISL